MSKKRSSLGRKTSKKVFKKGTRVNGMNAKLMPMRGGIRL